MVVNLIVGLLALRMDTLFTPAPKKDRSFYLSEFDCGKNVGCNKTHNMFGVWCPIVRCGEQLGNSNTGCDVLCEMK